MREIFVDFDETLVYTAKGVSTGFLFNADHRFEATIEQLEQRKKFLNLVDRWEVLGDVAAQQELENWAKQISGLVVVFLDDSSERGKEFYASKLRPGAKEFLRRMVEVYGRVQILTTGLGWFQERVIAAHGIGSYINKVYGREMVGIPGRMIKESGGFAHPIMVDDCRVESTGFWQKCIELGILTWGDLGRFKEELDYVKRREVIVEKVDRRYLPILSYSPRGFDTELYRITSILEDWSRD